MKLKVLIGIVLSIVVMGCASYNLNNPITTDAKSASTVKLNTQVPNELTIAPKDTKSYSSYSGDWFCKDSQSELIIEVDGSGNVKGNITTVVGTHVPSCLIEGVVINDKLVTKLEDESFGYTGTLTVFFINQNELRCNIKLINADKAYWKLAEGEMLFQKYSNF